MHHTQETLTETAIKEWENVGVDECRNYLSSLRKRAKQVVAEGGAALMH